MEVSATFPTCMTLTLYSTVYTLPKFSRDIGSSFISSAAGMTPIARFVMLVSPAVLAGPVLDM